MKAFIYSCLLAVFLFQPAFAQRLLPGQKAIAINMGTFSDHQVSKNYSIGLEFSTNHKRGNYHFWRAEYQRRTSIYQETNLPVETFLAAGGYSFYVLGLPSKRVNLNTAVEATGGYQLINKNDRLLADGAEIRTKSGFVYGAGGRLSIETFLTNTIIISLQGKAQYIWGMKYNQFRPSAGIGLRFNL